MRRHTILRDVQSAASLDRRPAPRYSYRINVLDRAFQILEFLSATQRGCQLADVSRSLKVPKSTVHRILMVLERHRYVRREPGDGKFRLGSKALQLESSAVAGMDVTEVCRPFLRQLVAETGETAHLGVLCDRQVISLANEQSWRTLTPSTIGRSVPAYCTSLGKALLAWIPENEVDEYLLAQKLESRTPNTIIRGEKLKAELRKIRQRGYSIDNEEFEEGLKCVAAAARNRSGQIAAAIGIAGPVSRLGRARMGPAEKSVIDAAAGLSEALGYRAGGPARVQNK